jgi:tetratricopeptide (TPR) repeat protein
MGIYFCHHCHIAKSSQELTVSNGGYTCPKCQRQMRGWESEDYEISDEAALAAYVYDHKEADGTWISGIPKHYSIQQVSEMVMQCEDQLKQSPRSVSAHFTLANYYITEQNLARAKYHLSVVLTEMPHHKKAFELMEQYFPEEVSQFVTQAPSKKKTDTSLSQVGKLSDKELVSTFQSALDFIETQRWEDAYPKLTQIIDHDFHHIGARRCLADYFLKKKDYENAVLQLSLLKGLKPNDFQIEFNLGVANYFARNLRRALASFKAAFEKCTDTEATQKIKSYINQIESELSDE